MGWLIILACGAMLVGSITMLRPSRTEARQTRLRQEAMLAGLRVKIRELSVPGEREPRRLAAYTLALQPEQIKHQNGQGVSFTIVRASNGGLDSINDNWQFIESDAGARARADALSVLVTNLNDEVVGLHLGSRVAAVYWNERAIEMDVAKIRRLLETLINLGCAPA